MSSAPQMDGFAFTPENLERANRLIARYPAGRQASAVLPLLDLAQRQHDNWVPDAALHHIADMLEMPYIRVMEVATFYTMVNLAPVGRFHLQLCRTTPCWLRGAGDLRGVVKDKLGIGHGQTTADGTFSLVEVECLGACVNAPVVQVNDDFYEDLDDASFGRLLDALAAGETPAAGPAVDRRTSAPITGQTTLTDIAPAAVRAVEATVPAPAPEPETEPEPVDAAPEEIESGAAAPEQVEAAEVESDPANPATTDELTKKDGAPDVA